MAKNDGSISIGIELDDSAVKKQSQTAGKQAGKKFKDGFDGESKGVGDKAKSEIGAAGKSAGSEGKTAGKKYKEGFDSGAKGLGDKVKSYIKGAGDSAKSIGKTGGSSFASSFASGIKGGAAAIGAAIVAAVTAGVTKSVEVAEERVGRMANLEVAAMDTGTNIDDAMKSYDRLIGQLGEVDRSVETTNNLLALADGNMGLLEDSTDAVIGAFARFPDSISIEGLAESLNETSRTGTIVGSAADAFNWATLSVEEWGASLANNAEAQAAFIAAMESGMTVEDAFNAALATTGDQQERAKILTDSLAYAYGDLGAAYEEANAPVASYRQAQDDLNQAMSDFGLVAMPLATEALNGLSGLLGGLAEQMPTLSEAFSSPEAFVGFVQGLVDSFVEAQPQMMQSFTELLWKGVEAIQAATPGLLEALATLLQNLVINIVNNGPAMLEAALTLFGSILNGLVDAGVLILGYLVLLIGMLLLKLAEWVIDMGAKGLEAGKALLDKLIENAGQIPGKIAEFITDILEKLGQWVADMGNKAKEAGQELLEKLMEEVGKIPEKMVEKGEDIVESLWEGILGAKDWIAGKFSSFVDEITPDFKLPFSAASAEPAQAAPMAARSMAAPVAPMAAMAAPMALNGGIGGYTPLASPLDSAVDSAVAAISAPQRAVASIASMLASSAGSTTNNSYYIGDTKVSTINQESFAKEFVALMNRYGRLANT